MERLVVAGRKTGMCVDATCRAAVGRGYDVPLASDTHTTRDRLRMPPANVVAHRNEVLDDFGNDAAAVNVVPSADIAF